MSTNALTVEIITPPAPLTLADNKFLTALVEVEGLISALKVSDATTAQQAADLQARLTTAGNALEKTRKALKQPYLDAGRAIDAAAEGPAGRIERAKLALKRQLTDYSVEQERIARQKEAERQAEIRRLEKIAAEEQAKRDEEQRRIAEAAAQCEESFPVDDEPAPEVPSAAQQAVAVAKAAPVIAPTAPTGIVFRTSLVPVVVDVMKVPEEWVTRTVKIGDIRFKHCTGWTEGMPLPVVPGIRFDVKKEPVSTGRR